MTSRTSRPFLVALAVLGGAVLLVVGLLVGVALAGSASAAAPSDGSVDAGFARDMQAHHGQAVEMSVMVREATDDADVDGLALDILLTQQNQQGQMAGWLATWGLPQSSTRPVMAWMSEPFADDGHDMAGMGTTGPEDAASPAGAGQNPMVAMGLATSEEMAALADADGVEAERIYLQLMIDHHLGGIAMAEVAAAEAARPEVRRLAAAMATGQTSELDRLNELLDARGGPVDL